MQMPSIFTTQAFLWLIVFVLSLLIEAAIPGLVSIWFALGAMAALIFALCGASLTAQVIAFLAVSVAALIVTRPLAKKYVNGIKQSTNADRLIGKIGQVTERIDPVKGTGRILVDGQDWAARAMDEDLAVEEGEYVVVRCIAGVKAFVEVIPDADYSDENMQEDIEK